MCTERACERSQARVGTAPHLARKSPVHISNNVEENC